MTGAREKTVNTYIAIVLSLVALVHLYPLILVVINSLKTFEEITANIVALPRAATFANFANAWKIMDYPVLFFNTLLATALGVAGVVLLGSLAGYKLSRTKTKYSWIFFILLIAPMMIPFHSFMIALVRVARIAGLTRTPVGLGILYWGLGVPLAVFFYHGFVKSVPKELDESASIDGAGPLRLFFQIVFPLLQPVTVSVIVINAMWMWNDFLLPLLVLGGSRSVWTLQLAANNFVGQFQIEWNYAMAGVLLTIVPAVALYLALQKYIIKGMVAGAVKI